MVKKVFFNPRCSKCQIAKSFLEKKKVKYRIYDYLSKGFSEKDIREILKKGLKVDELIRKNEPEYEEHVKGKRLTENEKIKILVKYPQLLQRPIVISGNRALIARDSKSLEKVPGM